MDTSAGMNIHDLAINKTMRQQFDSQAKKEKSGQHSGIEETSNIDDKNRGLKASAPDAVLNTAQQQLDIQAQSIRVERQHDVQAAKETIPQPDRGISTETNSKETGKYIDIIT